MKRKVELNFFHALWDWLERRALLRRRRREARRGMRRAVR